jgi:D-alanine-D-alanine ligase
MTVQDLKRKKIGVLMGGISPERDISLKTGGAVLKALLAKGYDAIGIDVDHSIAARLTEENIEIAFIALHGPWGEDGTIQGLLEMMGIPYTGSGVLASALAMNKIVAKKVFAYHELPTPEFQIVPPDHKNVVIALDFPLVAKPVCGGSTIGISIVESADALRGALIKASEYDQEIFIEQYVDGRDLTVGVLNGEHLPVIEIVPVSGFYDFEAKYSPGKTDYIVPARVSDELTGRAQKLAVAAYRVLHCSGAARVDFRLNKQEALSILEVNTIPGLTESSLLPMAAAKANMDFSTLTERILAAAQLHNSSKHRGRGRQESALAMGSGACD